MTIRAYTEQDIPAMTGLWNEIVDEGNAFPQTRSLTA
jgi:L-amino acid N-acyltransferase YncA